MLVVLKCHWRWNLSSKTNHKNTATDSSQLGQWLRWPEPQCGRHQQGWHHLSRHGSSTHGVPALPPPIELSPFHWEIVKLLVEKNILIWSWIFLYLVIVNYVSWSKREGRTLRKTWDDQYWNDKASVSRSTVQPPARSFHRVKNIYTLKKNILVKTRQDLDNKLYLSTFRIYILLLDSLLPQWERNILI